MEDQVEIQLVTNEDAMHGDAMHRVFTIQVLPGVGQRAFLPKTGFEFHSFFLHFCTSVGLIR